MGTFLAGLDSEMLRLWTADDKMEGVRDGLTLANATFRSTANRWSENASLPWLCAELRMAVKEGHVR